MKTFIFAAILLAASIHAHAEVEVHHGYLRASAPGAPNSAGFMVLYNRGQQDIALTSAVTDAASVTELHNHIDDNGIMRMRQVARIPVPAGGRVELKPGGYHLMLMGLESRLSEGQTVAVTLSFDDGSMKQLALPVKRGVPARQHGDGHGHPHQHDAHHQGEHSADHHH